MEAGLGLETGTTRRGPILGQESYLFFRLRASGFERSLVIHKVGAAEQRHQGSLECRPIRSRA